MNKKPIAKKHFAITEPTGFKAIYDNYLKHNGCTGLIEIQNFFSRIDALVNSGSSTITGTVPRTCIVEYKNRFESITKWWNESVILEKMKYDEMVNLSFKLGAAPALYVMEHNECVLIYDLRQDSQYYLWYTKMCPVENGSRSQVYIPKEVTFLPYSTADFIISKKDWKRKTKEDLTYYLAFMKEKYYGIKAEKRDEEKN